MTAPTYVLESTPCQCLCEQYTDRVLSVEQLMRDAVTLLDATEKPCTRPHADATAHATVLAQKARRLVAVAQGWAVERRTIAVIICMGCAGKPDGECGRFIEAKEWAWNGETHTVSHGLCSECEKGYR